MPPPERFEGVLPSTWLDVPTFEIDSATQAVTLTRAGESWARDQGAKIRADTYQLTLDDDGQVTFTGLLVDAPEEDVARGRDGNWFKGPGALKDAVADALAAGFPIWEIDILTREGEVSWQSKGDRRPADQTWTVYEADDGSIFMYDKEVGPSSRFPIAEASTITPTGPGVEPIGKGIKNADGSVTKFYSVTDSQGRTSMQSVKEWDTITKDSAISLETGGTLIPTGGGRYAYEPPPEAPFTTSPDDVVQVAGGQLVKTSKNQYQFVRDTYDPGVKTDPGTGRQFVQSASGTWTELDPRFQQGVVESGGREFLQQTTGALAELAPRFTPEVTEVDGMSLLQQRSGAISQLAKPNLDQIITQALVDGEYDKAFAFQDFQRRPTAQEAFNTALAFARSPADQILISAIARGEQTVQPPPPGTIQRVGPQADFLVQAYQDFQRRTQAGRAPTEEEATTLSARAAAGASPLTDTLQTRLESMTRDMERKDEEHAVKMQGLIQKQSEEAQLFQTKLNTALGLNADGSAKTIVPTAPLTGASSGADSTVSTTGTTAAFTSQANMPLVWNKLNEDQKALFTDHFTRNKGRAPVGAEALTDFALADITAFEERVKHHLSSMPVGTPGGPVVTSEQGNPASGIFYNPQYSEPETGTPTGTGASAASIVAPTAPIPSSIGGMTSGQWTVSNILDEIGRGRTGGGAGTLDVYGEGTTFADVAAAVGEPVTPAMTLAAETAREQASMKAERMDLASNLAAARSGAGGPTDWKSDPGVLRAERAIQAVSGVMPPEGGFRRRAGGGTVRPGEITVVGEQGPEIAMMPPGTHILPLGRATKRDIRAAQTTGRAYQQGGIVFGELPFGLRQLQAGRPITPSRGYLSRAAGLTLPSAQALANLTPETRDVYFDLAAQAGIPARAFGQELQTALPSGRRLPTSRMLPFSSRGVR